MYTNFEKCPICGKEQEYSVRNSKNNDNDLCEVAESIVLDTIGDDIFKVEFNIKCFSCRNKFKVIKDIKFDLK